MLIITYHISNYSAFFQMQFRFWCKILPVNCNIKFTNNYNLLYSIVSAKIYLDFYRKKVFSLSDKELKTKLLNTIEILNNTITQQANTIKELNATIEELQCTISELNKTIKELNEETNILNNFENSGDYNG